jgi:hypothetical protein
MDVSKKRALRAQGWEDWSMVFHEQLRRLWPLAKARVLKPMDFMVLDYYLSHLEVGSGRIEVSTFQAADELGMHATDVSNALGRLRSAQVMAKGLKGTGYYWMLNPSLCHVGGEPAYEKRCRQWEQLLEVN